MTITDALAKQTWDEEFKGVKNAIIEQQKLLDSYQCKKDSTFVNDTLWNYNTKTFRINLDSVMKHMAERLRKMGCDETDEKGLTLLMRVEPLMNQYIPLFIEDLNNSKVANISDYDIHINGMAITLHQLNPVPCVED